MITGAEGNLLVFGASGQLGSAWRDMLDRLRQPYIPLYRKDVDLTDREAVFDICGRNRACILVNCAAYTQVDKAEEDTQAAFKINADFPRYLAEWSAKNDAVLIHYSTEYIYSGHGDRPHIEQEEPMPVNVYGQSKLAGEKGVCGSLCNHLLFRTSWVYSVKGRNFMTSILKKMIESEEIKVVDDQTGSPTYAPDLARWSWQALQHRLAGTGAKPDHSVFNLCAAQFTDRHTLANYVREQAARRGITLKNRAIEAVKTSAFPLPAERPLNSRMSLEKFSRYFGIAPEPWQSGVNRFLDEAAHEGF
jgi:dTDP-4-dehydrorhamnose reductase